MASKEPEKRDPIQEVYDAHGVVLEEIRDEIRVLAEGFSLLSDKIDELAKRLQAVEDRLTTMEIHFEGVENELKEIRALLRQKVSAEEYQALEKRVTNLEHTVAA